MINSMANKKNDYKKLFFTYAIISVLFVSVAFISPEKTEDIGALSIISPLFLLTFIFMTKRIMEALILGTLLSHVMMDKGDFLFSFNNTLWAVAMDETTVWIIIVCGILGSIIALLQKSGGAYAFGEWVSVRAKTKKSALLWTWLLGMLIFIDDYLNSLTVGSSMAPVTDKQKISREMLAYVVDSTAAPTCIIIPFSTWAIFIAGLLEENGLAAEGEGFAYFLKTIPYNFYAWFAVIVVLLIILEIIPVFGPMKKAEQRAQETGQLAPDGSDQFDITLGDIELPEKPKVLNFFLPLIVLIASTIYFDIDVQMGVIITIAFMFLLYIPQNIVTPEEFVETSVDGFKNMVFVLILLVFSFTFASGAEAIGFIDFIVDNTSTIMTPELLPVIVFIVFGITEFIMGLVWSLYVIALPIVIPIALNIGADPVLAVAAVCSAGVWGSHVCFYVDATLLSSAASGCNNYRHAITQMPFAILAAVLSCIAFIIAGHVI